MQSAIVMAASFPLKKIRPLIIVANNVHFHTSRFLEESHYDVLKLKQTCSDKDIRDAFISLSKQFHPDINQQNGQAHAQFIKINEAYSILGKTTSRQEYDFLLQHESVGKQNWEVHSTSPGERVWRDETIWHMRNRSKDGEYHDKPYYGINGIRKLSNFWIVIACLVFTSVGVALQTLAIRNAFTVSRTILDQKSKEISKTHEGVRLQAELNGNQRQLELLRQRLRTTDI